jgi:hypothetical protein
LAGSAKDAVDAAERNFLALRGLPMQRDVDLRMVSAQQKKRRLDHDEPNWQIRNHENGFVYAREGINPPEAVLLASQTVFDKCTELDFGAVDVIYNAKTNRAYVLEVNTAPGLEGQTLEDYAKHFLKGI